MSEIDEFNMSLSLTVLCSRSMDCSYLTINVEATMWYFNIRVWLDIFLLSSHALKVEHCLNKAFKRSVQCFYLHFPLTFYRWHWHQTSLVCDSGDATLNLSNSNDAAIFFYQSWSIMIFSFPDSAPKYYRFNHFTWISCRGKNNNGILFKFILMGLHEIILLIM